MLYVTLNQTPRIFERRIAGFGYLPRFSRIYRCGGNGRSWRIIQLIPN
jgi:hypothetical protein